ncbi:MAG: hypothetical protein QXR42_08360, partial [Candidatus Bathyarchaeia archaeon]
EDPREYFYFWLVDRGCNGLANTVKQFVGLNGTELHEFYLDAWEKGNRLWFNEVANNYNALDQFLTRNWKYWDLVKFIIGYERWNSAATETEDIPYIMPETLRMYGFPAGGLGIDPIPLGACGEWTVGLPPYVVNKMRESFPDSNILFAPGYMFGLMSCGDGLIKERGIDVFYKPIDNGILEVFDALDGKFIYLMKRD